MNEGDEQAARANSNSTNGSSTAPSKFVSGEPWPGAVLEFGGQPVAETKGSEEPKRMGTKSRNEGADEQEQKRRRANGSQRKPTEANGGATEANWG